MDTNAMQVDAGDGDSQVDNDDEFEALTPVMNDVIKLGEQMHALETKLEQAEMRIARLEHQHLAHSNVEQIVTDILADGLLERLKKGYYLYKALALESQRALVAATNPGNESSRGLQRELDSPRPRTDEPYDHITASAGLSRAESAGNKSSSGSSGRGRGSTSQDDVECGPNVPQHVADLSLNRQHTLPHPQTSRFSNKGDEYHTHSGLRYGNVTDDLDSNDECAPAGGQGDTRSSIMVFCRGLIVRASDPDVLDCWRSLGTL